MEIFRELTKQEEAEFRQWARDNYDPFDPIPAIWHPVVQEECNIMNTEADPPKMKSFTITAECIVSYHELDADDKECLGQITEPFYIDAVDEERALDHYHNIIPIACLEDFVITCKETGE